MTFSNRDQNRFVKLVFILNLLISSCKLTESKLTRVNPLPLYMPLYAVLGESIQNANFTKQRLNLNIKLNVFGVQKVSEKKMRFV